MACAIKANESIASQTISSNTDTSSQKFSVSASTKNIIAIMKVSSRTDGTYTLKLEHSHDGSNWEVLKAGSGVTTNDTVYVAYSEASDGPCLSLVRLTVTSASVTTGATVEAEARLD